jgi:zinc transporter, ZIP family
VLVAEAFAWGFIAASSLLRGGLLALRRPIGLHPLGLIMAFGSGVLINAVAYELVEDAFGAAGGSGAVGLGLFAGALTFYLGDLAIDRFGGEGRKSAAGGQDAGSALAILLGTVLDGIPESIVLGLSLLGGGRVSIAMVPAVFLSNLPESLSCTAGLKKSGWPRQRILGLWVVVSVLSALSALAGYAFFDGASEETIAFVQAFAGGALLTMLAETMMPEAFEYGGKQVGLVTTLGFALAFFITTLE